MHPATDSYGTMTYFCVKDHFVTCPLVRCLVTFAIMLCFAAVLTFCVPLWSYCERFVAVLLSLQSFCLCYCFSLPYCVSLHLFCDSIVLLSLWLYCVLCSHFACLFSRSVSVVVTLWVFCISLQSFYVSLWIMLCSILLLKQMAKKCNTLCQSFFFNLTETCHEIMFNQ